MTADWSGFNVIDATTAFARLAGLPEAVGFDVDELRRLRVRLLDEEHTEYVQGEGAVIDRDDGVRDGSIGGTDVWFVGAPDRVEICDGLADVIVIAWGTLLAYVGEEVGTEVLREVWESNLAKVDGRHGPIVRREDGKLLKPEGWQPPDVEGVLRRHGLLR